MVACPSIENLERLLVDQLSDPERRLIEVHVEDCAACQETLHHLALSTPGPTPPDLLTALAEAPRWETTDEAEAFLQQLGQRVLTIGLDGRNRPPTGPGECFEPPELEGYEILEELGRGAMGVVYRARHRELGRLVALKMIPGGPHLSPGARQRFRLEARAIARLRHPNIVQVYDVGEQDGCPYLSLELVEGDNLARWLGGVPRPAAEAARVVAVMAGAVEYAHRQGVIHRDLKPANVLLGGATGGPAPPPGPDAKQPAEYEIKITDFGLAKVLPGPGAAEDRLTQTGMVLGTPAYVAPEQVHDKEGKVGPTADVYSLGAILYELLTGHPPFQGSTPMETLLQAAHQEPVPPARLVPQVPRDLDTICLKCLEKDPGRRYATAGDLAADLGRFLSHEPIRARAVGPLGRLARWGRRNPVPVGLLTALVLTGLVAIAAILWQWRKAELAGDEARRQGEAERWARYRANVGAAAAALQLENGGLARRALEAAPEEHRNWEWRHLHSQLDNSRAVMPGIMPTMEQSGWWRRPIVSPTGEQVATLNRDGRTIDLWDTSTGSAVGALRGHEGPIYTLAYTPDGKRLASGSADRTIRLWDVATGEEAAVLRGPEKPVEWLSYSPDGRRLFSLDGGHGRLWDPATGQVVASLGGPIGLLNALFTSDSRRLAVGLGHDLCLWDAATGRRLAVLGSHEHPVNHLAVSPDGGRIASHGDHETFIRLWETSTGREVAVLRGHANIGGTLELAFSPDGSRLISGGAYPDNTVRLWEAASGRPIAIIQGHKNTVGSVAFSPDGRRITSASLDQTAGLWDGVDGRPVAVLRGHTERVWAAPFSPDGRRVVTASADQTLRLWDATSGDPIAVLLGHAAEVRGATFAASGSLLVSLSTDGEARVWDMELAERNGILRGHESFVYDLAFSPDGDRVASAAWDGTVRLWDVTTGRQTGLLQLDPSHTADKIGNSVAWHPDGDRLATATRDDTIAIWDLATGKPERVFNAPTGDWTGDARAVFDPSSTLLASGSRDGSVRLWDVAAGRPAGVLQGHKGPALGVAFRPDGRQLASAGFDRTVRLWDVATRATVKVLAGDESYRVAYSADGRLIAAGSIVGTVRLWDARTYEELAVLPHGTRVLGLAFSPDGTRLATACGDNTVRLWDVATRQEVCELRGHSAYVHAVAFSPDGTRLASASGDFTVRLWDSVPPSVRARRGIPALRGAATSVSAPSPVTDDTPTHTPPPTVSEPARPKSSGPGSAR